MDDVKTRDLLRQLVNYGCLGRYTNSRAWKSLSQQTCFHLFCNVSQMSFTILNFLRFSFRGSNW